MGKLIKTAIVGIASGVATAYFLSTKQGKKFQKKAKQAYEAYTENPEEYHHLAKEKASEYTHLAVETFNDYKDKLESGELTTDEIFEAVREKGQAVVHYTGEKVSDVISKVVETEVADASETKAEVDDIIFDYQPAEDDAVEQSI